MADLNNQEGFIQNLVETEAKKHLPIRPFWFSVQALDPTTGRIGRFVRAVAKEVTTWILAIKLLRGSLFLDTAVGDYLDDWGRDLGTPRQSSEVDDDYRARIKRRLLQEKLTRPAIRNYITSITGLPTEVLLPWQYEMRFDHRGLETPEEANEDFYAYSGGAVYGDEYHAAGVIDVVTEGYSPLTRSLAEESVAGGIQTYYTVRLQEQADLSYPTEVKSHGSVIWSTTLVPRWSPELSYDGDWTYGGGHEPPSSVSYFFEPAITPYALNPVSTLAYCWTRLVPNASPLDHARGLVNWSVTKAVSAQVQAITTEVDETVSRKANERTRIWEYEPWSPTIRWDDFGSVTWIELMESGTSAQRPGNVTIISGPPVLWGSGGELWDVDGMW